MKVHEERGHGVEEAVTMPTPLERDPHEQPAVLERVRQVGGDDDRHVAVLVLGEPDHPDGGQAQPLQPLQDLVLAAAHLERLLLEGQEPAVDDDEADEVAGRPDRQLAQVELVRPPRLERGLPGQGEERRRGLAEPQARERLAQIRFRR
jgi:hypothetical protein